MISTCKSSNNISPFASPRHAPRHTPFHQYFTQPSYRNSECKRQGYVPSGERACGCSIQNLGGSATQESFAAAASFALPTRRRTARLMKMSTAIFN